MLQLKLLKRARDGRNSRLEERWGLKYFYLKATHPQRSSDTERRKKTGARQRGWTEGKEGGRIEEDREREPCCHQACLVFLVCSGCWRLLPLRPLRCWFQGLLGRPAWSRHHGLSGKLPGDWPRHFEPLHPYRQLRYLATRLPDILYNVWLSGQRSYQGVRPGPTTHSVAHQTGGDAELLGTCGTVGHSQHDHHLPRAIELRLQGEEEHDGLSATYLCLYPTHFCTYTAFYIFLGLFLFFCFDFFPGTMLRFDLHRTKLGR